MLFDTFVTTVWKPSCAKLRECTKVGYESALNCHILPQWSGRDMDAISVAVHIAKVGMMAFAFGNTSFTSDINSNGQIVNETMDTGFLPEDEGTILLEGVNGQHGALSFDADGNVTISGSMNSGYYFRVCGCWPVK